MGDYHDLYLKTDVLLLVDVFEKFIKTCLEYYKLDTCHYFSAPGLSWEAMLKMTIVELKLIPDTDRHLFIERRYERSIYIFEYAYICKRPSKIEDCDSNKKKINPLSIGMQIICMGGE